MLVPLPQGLYRDYDLTTRAVLGALYNRIRLSGYNHIGDPTGQAWYDPDEQSVYCIYAQQDLADMVGVSVRSIRRALDRLHADSFVWWRKCQYGGACRYYLDARIIQDLAGHWQ